MRITQLQSDIFNFSFLYTVFRNFCTWYTAWLMDNGPAEIWNLRLKKARRTPKLIHLDGDRFLAGDIRMILAKICDTVGSLKTPQRLHFQPRPYKTLVQPVKEHRVRPRTDPCKSVVTFHKDAVSCVVRSLCSVCHEHVPFSFSLFCRTLCCRRPMDVNQKKKGKSPYYASANWHAGEKSTKSAFGKKVRKVPFWGWRPNSA